MIYFGENNEYILCECETCKGEMYIERTSVSEQDAYAYHLYMPVKCRCGAIDEYINRAKKSCHGIKHELSALHELLRRQQGVSNKIGDITAELNKKIASPSFLQSVGRDLLFSLKVFYLLIAFIGVEIFLFIITGAMFFCGTFFDMPDLSQAGNELFYYVNIFKDGTVLGFINGGEFLSKLGFDSVVKPLSEYNVRPNEGLIFGYIPAAIAGVIIFVFYIFLAVFIIRLAINVARLTFFASKVVNRRIRINQRREEYRRQLDELGAVYQNLSEQINDFTILPADYKNLRAADSILRYFLNNRVDTIREAMNLYHDEDLKNRQLEYIKGMYNETRQTRRYTKALYMLTSDENIKVDVKDMREESYSTENERDKVGEMLKDAFEKIKKTSPSKVSRLAAPNPETQPEEIHEPPEPEVSDIPAEVPEDIIELVEATETAEVPEEPENTGDTDAESLNAIFDGAQKPDGSEN